MTSYKCYQCNRSFDKVMMLYVCFICEKMLCGYCNHSHSIFAKDNDDSLKQIIKDKSKITYDLILSFYNFDAYGYPHNMIYHNVNFDEVEENRKIMKQYTDIKYMGICDFKTFYDNLLKIKMKFRYKLFKLLLLNYFCHDITESILEFL